MVVRVFMCCFYVRSFALMRILYFLGCFFVVFVGVCLRRSRSVFFIFIWLLGFLVVDIVFLQIYVFMRCIGFFCFVLFMLVVIFLWRMLGFVGANCVFVVF